MSGHAHVQARSHKKEIILVHFREKEIGMALNMILNLRKLTFEHFILLTLDESSCQLVLSAFPKAGGRLCADLVYGFVLPRLDLCSGQVTPAGKPELSQDPGIGQPSLCQCTAVFQAAHKGLREVSCLTDLICHAFRLRMVHLSGQWGAEILCQGHCRPPQRS